MSEDVGEEEVSNIRCGDSRGGGNEVNTLGKAVHNHKDRIKVALGLGQVGDEIHRDLFPSCLWGGEWLEKSGDGTVGWLIPLASLAVGDILLDILLQSWPEEIPSDASVCLVDA